mmetsp:Transcript_87206/g.244094  ORF Transcript_87206/g.244094 Transcript_87206/m.244094 type:complete len:664 (+) Transcript_87206:115-2106(+)
MPRGHHHHHREPPRQQREVQAPVALSGPAEPSADRAERTVIFSKTKMCKFHILGMCAKGEACKFAHHKDELNPLPDLSRTKLCKTLISTGSCNDPHCSYAHNREEMRAMPGGSSERALAGRGAVAAFSGADGGMGGFCADNAQASLTQQHLHAAVQQHPQQLPQQAQQQLLQGGPSMLAWATQQQQMQQMQQPLPTAQQGEALAAQQQQVHAQQLLLAQVIQSQHPALWTMQQQQNQQQTFQHGVPMMLQGFGMAATLGAESGQPQWTAASQPLPQPQQQPQQHQQPSHHHQERHQQQQQQQHQRLGAKGSGPHEQVRGHVPGKAGGKHHQRQPQQPPHQQQRLAMRGKGGGYQPPLQQQVCECGTAAAAGAKFCPSCGARQDAALRDQDDSDDGQESSSPFAAQFESSGAAAPFGRVQPAGRSVGLPLTRRGSAQEDASLASDPFEDEGPGMVLRAQPPGQLTLTYIGGVGASSGGGPSGLPVIPEQEKASYSQGARQVVGDGPCADTGKRHQDTPTLGPRGCSAGDDETGPRSHLGTLDEEEAEHAADGVDGSLAATSFTISEAEHAADCGHDGGRAATGSNSSGTTTAATSFTSGEVPAAGGGVDRQWGPADFIVKNTFIEFGDEEANPSRRKGLRNVHTAPFPLDAMGGAGGDAPGEGA